MDTWHQHRQEDTAALCQAHVLPAVTRLSALFAPLYSSRALPGQPAACLHQPPWSETLPAQQQGTLVSHARLAGHADRAPLSVGKRDVLGNTRDLTLPTFSCRCTEGYRLMRLHLLICAGIPDTGHACCQEQNTLWRATVHGHGQPSPPDQAHASCSCCMSAASCAPLQLMTSDLDERNITELSKFDAAVALEILEHYCAGDLSQVRNRRAYLAGQARLQGIS